MKTIGTTCDLCGWKKKRIDISEEWRGRIDGLVEEVRDTDPEELEGEMLRGWEQGFPR